MSARFLWKACGVRGAAHPGCVLWTSVVLLPYVTFSLAARDLLGVFFFCPDFPACFCVDVVGSSDVNYRFALDENGLFFPELVFSTVAIFIDDDYECTTDAWMYLLVQPSALSERDNLLSCFLQTKSELRVSLNCSLFIFVSFLRKLCGFIRPFCAAQS